MLQPNVKFLMFNYIPSVKAYLFLMSGFVTNALLEIEQLLHKTVGVNVPHVVHCLLKQKKSLSMLHDPFVGDIDIYNLRPLYRADQRHIKILSNCCWFRN